MSNFGSFGEPLGELEVPDVGGPIRAWRVWRVDEFRGRWGLSSARIRARTSHLPLIDGRISRTSQGSVYWPVGGLEARCLCRAYQSKRVRVAAEHLPHDPCPGPPPRHHWMGYGCGVYGMRDRGKLLNAIWPQGAHVLGQVELGGRVWEHREGWRAQYARVVSLDLPLADLAHQVGWYELHDVLQELARRYRVPYELKRMRGVI